MLLCTYNLPTLDYRLILYRPGGDEQTFRTSTFLVLDNVMEEAPVREIFVNSPVSFDEPLVLAEVLGVRRQQQEAVRGEECPAIVEQRIQVRLQPPRATGRPVSVRWWVEHDPVVSIAPPPFARSKCPRVVHQPADRRVSEAVRGGVAPGPGHCRPRGVHVRDGGSGGSQDQCDQAGVREQVQHSDCRRVRGRGRPSELGALLQPREHRRLFREAPHLPGLGGAQLQVDAADPCRPSFTRCRRRGPRPATLAVEAQVGVVPTLRCPTLPVRAAMWPVRHVLAEKLQAGAAARIDELVIVHGSIITETATHGPSYPVPDKDNGRDLKENPRCVDPRSRW